MSRTPIPRGDDLADLLREHGSYGAVARLLGCSATGVAYAAKRDGIRAPGLRGGRRTCAICRTTSDERLILRFGLSASPHAFGSREHRSAGSVSLCEGCWRELVGRSKPRRLQVAA